MVWTVGYDLDPLDAVEQPALLTPERYEGPAHVADRSRPRWDPKDTPGIDDKLKANTSLFLS